MRVKWTIAAALLAVGGAEAAELRFDGEAIAWQPVTVTADLGCSEFVGVSNEGGVIRIATKRQTVAGCDPNAKSRAITIGSFPPGEQPVELYYETQKVAAIDIVVAGSNAVQDAPAFAVDGWWAADRGDGNGLFLQRGPDGALYGSLLTYDPNGTSTFLTFQGWRWSSETQRYAGPIYRTTGGVFGAEQGFPVGAARVGDGSLEFETVQCLVAPCEVNPDRLRFSVRTESRELSASFRRVGLPRQ